MKSAHVAAAHPPADSQDYASHDITIAVPGGDLIVSLSGAGSPLLLLHAWTLDRRMWQPQLPGLGSHFRLIMPDRRGFGRSTASPGLTLERDDIARIADTLGHDRLAIAGASQGAAVALNYALALPDRVTALVLAGTPLAGLVPDADDIPRDHYAALARADDFRGLRDEWTAHPLMRLNSASARALVAEMLADYRARDLIAPSSLPPLSAEAIAALPVPLLALSGTGDTTWRTACARYLAEKVPQGVFAMIENAGHLPNIEQPEAFNALVRSFLCPS